MVAGTGGDPTGCFVGLFLLLLVILGIALAEEQSPENKRVKKRMERHGRHVRD